MPKRSIPGSRLEVMLDASSPVPLYRQLYERLRKAILSGQLERGARLPSTRQFASSLGISRTTIVLAYEYLTSEGYLESRTGQGTVVARDLPSPPLLLRPDQTQEKPEEVPPPALHLAPRVRPLQEILFPMRYEGSPRGTTRIHDPAVDQFPYEVWARLIARRARQLLRFSAHYQEPAGYLPLREAIATHISVTRGVRCGSEQVIITTGSQGALDLAARTLLTPGDAAWLENPGYFGARGALLSAEARLIPVPVDEQGLNVELGQQLCPTARLVSTTPSHQFPTGVTMSLPRRLALLSWAREAEAWILEDDYDSEYRWSGRPLEALQGLDQAGRVLYIGTFSKVLFPSLRLGYLVAPTALLASLLATRYFIDVHVPILEQMALCDFLREGYYARHLRQTRAYYRQRRERLHDALCTHLGDLLDVQAPEAGMHLVGWLPPGKDDSRAQALAAKVGIEVARLSGYSLSPLPRGGLVFSFGYASTDEQAMLLRIKRLAAALQSL